MEGIAYKLYHTIMNLILPETKIEKVCSSFIGWNALNMKVLREFFFNADTIGPEARFMMYLELSCAKKLEIEDKVIELGLKRVK